ncbi:putative transcriptional regulator [Nocardioides cavernae]|uniref:Putative transcriptional regulator n=1 Tax=Nocardioides cavernae TaxID=1921566 RepID=A0A7Y9KQM1_9ACTN|nr:DNA-binding protein [Nocardioides cavernae]NYE35740.1 putative transcriptional regulator [Nocardioides cavernae]
MVAQSESRQRQQELYGAAIGDVLDRVTATLGISRAAVARTIGVSAPMLSQLASGRRTTIGNPLAVQRLRALVQLCDEVAAGLAHSEVAVRIEGIREQDSTTLTGSADRAAPTTAELLRAVASGQDLLRAADLLEAEHPALSELIRVHGTGSAEDVRAHLDGLAHLR